MAMVACTSTRAMHRTHSRTVAGEAGHRRSSSDPSLGVVSGPPQAGHTASSVTKSCVRKPTHDFSGAGAPPAARALHKVICRRRADFAVSL